MNRKAKKLLYIRSKNHMKSIGYNPPKWICTNKIWPTVWVNTSPTLYEASWSVDMSIKKITRP